MYEFNSKEIENFFTKKGWGILEYQKIVWQHYLNGKSGIINAPTGSGKTYAAFMGVVIEELNSYLLKKQNSKSRLKVIWITPLRSLTNDISNALQTLANELELDWKVEVRSGDTPSSIKSKQIKNLPDVIVTTPESLHLMFTLKEYELLFSELKLIVVDELHELMESKRGVQTELALSRLKNISRELKIWGISATIGNLDESLKVLLGDQFSKGVIIKADLEKNLNIQTIFPDYIEKFSWAGHLGINLIKKVINIIEENHTTLIFINTRSQTEIWFSNIINLRPDFEKNITIHHGSIDQNARLNVEKALAEGKLKAVFCTSSLDLGIDFKPVDAIIQIGSPKGVSRFLQRAGRSGHGVGKESKIYFLPTYSLELLEASALKQAIKDKLYDNKITYKKPIDVLIQYLVTLASSEGFYSKHLYKEIVETNSYKYLKLKEWKWALKFITTGGNSLKQYPQYSKVIKKDDFYFIKDKRIILRHKLSMGTITSDESIKIKMTKGHDIGRVEESFVAQLKQGETFWFAGKNLEFITLENMIAYVRISKSKSGITPSWVGGRMPLSSKLSLMIKRKIDEYLKFKDKKNFLDKEMLVLSPLLDLQNSLSKLPNLNEFLIEELNSQDGYHLFFYPFEGRTIHEGFSSLVAYRISKSVKASFTFAMNDYGFELLTENPFNLPDWNKIFDTTSLQEDILNSINSTEMAKRKFRDIARISGLTFSGFPGEKNKSKLNLTKSLQISSSLLFEVFKKYDPDNLLIKQSYDEVLNLQLNKKRILNALNNIKTKKIVFKSINQPTPFCFPIIVDSMRDKLSSESFSERIKKMQLRFED